MRPSALKQPFHSAWAEINLKAIRNNFRVLRALARKQGVSSPSNPLDLLPVIKAEAYGHGMMEVARVLVREGVNFLGVSDVPEGVALRRGGITKNILLLESTFPQLADQVVRYRLTPGLCTHDFAKALNRCAQRAKRNVPVHVKIDTGMGRLGVPLEQAFEFIWNLRKFPRLKIQGIFTHFPVADSDPEFTKRQILKLRDLHRRLFETGIQISYIHAANSIGLAAYKNIFNLARPGLMLYGLYPAKNNPIKLQPAMGIRARVIFVKQVPKGAGISYGHTYKTPRPIKVATLAIGYSDGYLRSLSNKGMVLLEGNRCPVVGRVTMDQIMADVSRCPSVKIGSVAVILGTQGRETISAEELARLAGTINYEITCSMGNKLPRIYSA